MLQSISQFVRMHTYDDQAHPGAALVLLGVVGLLVGRMLGNWVRRQVGNPPLAPRQPCAECGRRANWVLAIPLIGPFLGGSGCGRCRTRASDLVLMELATSLIWMGLFWGIAQGRCQEIVEGGRLDYYPWRILSQLVLVSLMLVATGTDLKDHTISDAVTGLGVLLGVAFATLAGNIQILPLWIDWSDPLVTIHGPYIPEWIKQHDHLHGLGWSASGLVVGAGLAWGVQFLSRAVLGHEALGTGDITLMGMIGAFLGWQPVVMAFAFAPLWAISLAAITWLMTGKTFIPYGPFLCAGALTVMFSWRWLWPPLRLIFGHPPSLLLIAGVMVAGFVILLGLLRLFKSLPVRSESRTV